MFSHSPGLRAVTSFTPSWAQSGQGTNMSTVKHDAPPLRSLADFKGTGYDKGRSHLIQAVWFAVQNMVFSKWWLPQALRPILLRLFGAQVGHNVLIRHRVRVLWPWKLSIGDNCWIGEDAWILNLEPVWIGHDVCVSQAAFLCTGSHDMTSSSFEYDNGPITISDGVWLGAQAIVLRGVTIGRGSVIAARARVSSDVSPGSLLKSAG
jgi:putative colanic acid biosynthesis acetyltransferase WcaF